MVSRQHEEHLDMRRARSKMFGSIGINSRKIIICVQEKNTVIRLILIMLL